MSTPAYRLPATPPHPGAATDLYAWEARRAASSRIIADSAAKWRAGTAAVFTALTGLLFLKGPDAAALDPQWSPWIIFLLIAAALALIVSFLSALAAEAPPIATLDYQTVIKEHGSLAVHDGAVAAQSARSLRVAQQFAIAAIFLFLAGTTVWLMAPKAGASALVTVTYVQQAHTMSLCGELVTSHQGDVLLTVPGHDRPVAVPLTQITDLTATGSCPG